MPRSQNNEVAGGLTHWVTLTNDDFIAAYKGGNNFTLPVIGVPKGAIVEQVIIHIVEAIAPGTVTFNGTVGDGDDADGWINVVSFNSAAGVTYQSAGAYLNDGTTNNTVNGKLYTSADTIDITASIADAELLSLTGGRVLVGVKMIDPSSYV